MKYVINNNISWQKIKDYIYIIKEDTDEIFYLNSTAKLVWEKIDLGYTIEEIIVFISKKFNCNKKINDNINNFITSLRNEGIIDES